MTRSSPPTLAESALQGKPVSGGNYSTLGRIINYVERHPADIEGSKAYARLEIMKMERGVSYLDIIYTGAPLIGLIGTVSGLLATAFSVIDPDTHMPEPGEVHRERRLCAFSATLLGLCIAVVALVGNGYLNRRIEHHAARLDVLLERILVSAGASIKEVGAGGSIKDLAK